MMDFRQQLIFLLTQRATDLATNNGETESRVSPQSPFFQQAYEELLNEIDTDSRLEIDQKIHASAILKEIYSNLTT